MPLEKKGDVQVRLIKMFGLAMLAAIASMAFLGASSASANQSTTLCKINQLPCAAANQWPKGTLIDGLTVGTALLLSSIVNVHCHGTANGSITSAALANPLVGSLTPKFTNCKTSGGEGCTVTSSAGTMLLLKTAKELAIATIHNVLARVQCGFFIDCSYVSNGVTLDALSLKSGVPALLHANEIELENEGGFLCPDESFWDALYEVTALNGLKKEGIHISS